MTINQYINNDKPLCDLIDELTNPEQSGIHKGDRMTDQDKKLIAEELKKQFPGISGIHYNQKEEYIFLGDAGEGGIIGEIPAADYYGEFRGGHPWVNPELENFLKDRNFGIEWFDSGTLVAFSNY